MVNQESADSLRDPERQRLDALADLLDNKFNSPGTSWRFGLDSIIGLIPYVGDLAGLAVSGYLFSILMRRGAGPIIMLRMLGNMLLDAMVGAIPILGDLFDFGWKANRRNVDMIQKYYASGKKRPNARVSACLVGLLLMAVFILTIYGTWLGITWIWCLLVQWLR